MAEKKYIFNPETLEHENTSRARTKKIIGVIISLFVSSIIVWAIIFTAFSYIIESPKQKKLKKEIAVFEKQYNQLLTRRRQQEEYLKELQEKDIAIYREIFQTEPEIDSSFSSERYIDFEKTNASKTIKENKKKLAQLNNEIKEQKTEYKKILLLVKSKRKNLKKIPAIQPVYNKDLDYHVSGFGKKIDQLYKSPVFHPGIDYAVPEGTKVFATADGIVTLSKNQRKYGNQILIKHDDKYQTRYSHLSETLARSGQRVKRGDVIGLAGNTGKSLIPHLHYEVIYNGKAVNPVNYFFLDLSPDEYLKVKYLANKTGLSLD